MTDTVSSRARFRLTAATLALISLVGVVAAAPAGASHSWAGYHWARTSNPLTLKVGDNVSSAWKPYLATTAADWSKYVLTTQVVPGTSSPKNCRATAGTVQVCNSRYGATGWLGIASVWASGAHITQGTVKLNDTYFNTARYNTPAWRNMVSCQEVGHTLGLDHQDETFDNANLGTCMDYTNNPSGGGGNGTLSNTSPNAHDYDELAVIYGSHTDTTNTTASSSASSNASTEHRADWGRAVHRDSQGREDHFVRDLGNGEQLFSFVIWAG